jgi:8-oxo-dGTP diphosphatase
MAFALIIPIVKSTGDYVFQRRTDDAPSDASLLGLFGGSIEPGETPLEAAFRELGEETSLKTSKEDLKFVFEADMPTESGLAHSHVFTLAIPKAEFNIYEGSGFEVMTRDAFLKRRDTSPGALRLLGLIS